MCCTPSKKFKKKEKGRKKEKRNTKEKWEQANEKKQKQFK